MRPLRLEMTGLRSFRTTQSLDFTDLSLFAVIGDTGAGKSSILEAIVFALYAASTWDARGGGALMSLDADAMSVTFDFSAGGKPYRVKRIVFRNTRPSEHALLSPGEPEYRFTGERQVNHEIRRLVGLDYETFKKTVVLPQGRFAALLDMSETDRVKVLTDLLGLDQIDRLREKLEPVRQDVVSRRRDVLGRRAELGADPAAEVVRFEAEERSARVSRDAMAAAREKLEESKVARSHLVERLRALDTVARECSEALSAAEDIRVLIPEHDRLQAELVRLAERRDGSERALADANKELRDLESTGRDVESLAVLLTDVRRLRDEDGALAVAAETLAQSQRALDEEDSALEDARETLAGLRTAADNAKLALHEAESQRNDALDRLARARLPWRAWIAASASLIAARSDLDEADVERMGLARRYSLLEAEFVAADSTYAANRTAFDSAERANRVAALAHEMHPGDACPVCQRPLPMGFEAPVAEGFAAAKKVLKASEKRRNEAFESREKGRLELDDAERRYAACEAALDARVYESAQAKNALPDFGLRVDAVDEDQALESLLVFETESLSALVAARERSEADQRAFIDADADIRARSRAHTAARAAHASASEALRKRADEAERVRVGMRAMFRPMKGANAAAFAGILGEIERARTHAISVASRTTELAFEAAEIERGLRETEGAYRRAVIDVASSNRLTLERNLAAVDSPLKICELTAPPVLVGASFEALISWSELLIDWCTQVKTAVTDRRARAAAEVGEYDDALVQILRVAGVETAEDFETGFEEQTALVATAVERLRAARSNAERADTLDRELRMLEPVASALEQLNRYLQNRAFKDFVMRRRERRLLGIGTEMLREMTGGRYAFAEGFEIMDYHADRVRSPKTLSGGETFLASLALALALVEVASRTGGKLDALFLDEGFGNLDAAALDDALSELAERAKTGKMIGIITHVRGIAEQIDTVLRVERRAAGSIIERLEGSMLGSFMEDEVRTGLLGGVQQ